MTREEFEVKREAAGRRYAAAVAELKAAWIDLSALDHLLASPRVAGNAHLRSFVGEMHGLPHCLVHPVYASGDRARWNDEARERLVMHLAAFV